MASQPSCCFLLTGVDVDDIAGDYVFKPNNPFMDDLHSFAKAKSLFRHGILSEAVYALEAEVGALLSVQKQLRLRSKRTFNGLRCWHHFAARQPACFICSNTDHVSPRVLSILTQI